MERKMPMAKSEFTLLSAFLRKAQTYVEWGCGSSTEIASFIGVPEITSIDSSKQWIEDTQKMCSKYKTQPKFLHVDIGELSEWGTPIDESKKDKWPEYHTSLWCNKTINADLYLIDGRFRVACFCQIYRHCMGNSIIAVHDFSSRQKHYSSIHEIGREIISLDDLSFFTLRKNKLDMAYKIFREYQYDYK
jgi:hypothetical protein